MSKKDDPPTYLECRVEEWDTSGIRRWVHEGKNIFVVNAEGVLFDLRLSPPFLSMSPCPYCGAEGPQVEGIKGHDPLKHIQRAVWLGDKKVKHEDNA